MNEQRLARLLERARQQALEAVVLMPGPNMFYLTGLNMHVSERPAFLCFPLGGQPWAFCPKFEAEKVTGATGITRVFAWGEEEGPGPVLRKAVAETGLGSGTLGVEYRYMRLLERELLASAVAAAPTVMAGTRQLHYEDVGAIFADLRSVKDEQELAFLQEAADLVDAGARAAHEKIAPGVSESEVAAYIQAEMQKLGASGPLHILVASGPRSGIPHAGTTDRVMADGELAWVDIVYVHKGYTGDITRTYPVGTVTGTLAEIYQVCCDAQQLARETATPEMTGAQVDALARNYITAKGFGQYFTHRTGHGLGLETHEEPYIVGSNHRPLGAGVTFTIEPGIYIPGLGGVRIEDDVVLESTGARSLTKYPRNLLVSGRS